jgi:ERCC4-related helicase
LDPILFVGKRGLTQKEQIEVVKRFREGGYNTLVATCVGEEGLDIGEIDLVNENKKMYFMTTFYTFFE